MYREQGGKGGGRGMRDNVLKRSSLAKTFFGHGKAFSGYMYKLHICVSLANRQNTSISMVVREIENIVRQQEFRKRRKNGEKKVNCEENREREKSGNC